MRLSTIACFARLLAILVFSISGHQAVSQNPVDNNTAQEIFSPSFDGTRNKSFDKFVAVHVAPSKIIAGELPVTLAVRVSPSWMLEVGAGAAFRDRVAEKLFDGNTLQLLPFANRDAMYQLGYAFYAGARYMIGKEALEGFYFTPEISYAHRNVSYPGHQGVSPNGRYDGWIRDANARLMLGYDRAWCNYSEHFFYGGFLGFGMRRYEASYYHLGSKVDPGTRHDVETIPTLHLGYRVGYKF